jgi:Cu(I)/Ag(I) efflux system membrane fusion protein
MLYNESSHSRKELLIREGMYVQKGQAVFNVYSTDKLWALLNVYAESQGSIAKGQVVDLFVDGKELSGSFKIDFIEPEIKPNQNTVTARVYLSNVNGSIKVGSNVKGNNQCR